VNSNTNNAFTRIKELERKILWRDCLAALICLIPFFILLFLFYLSFSADNRSWAEKAASWKSFAGGAGLEAAMVVAFIMLSAIFFVFWLVARDMLNFLFGADFASQVECYTKIKQKIAVEKACQNEKEQKMKEAHMLSQIEADLRAAGKLKDR